jgi:hypothetical protein
MSWLADFVEEHRWKALYDTLKGLAIVSLGAIGYFLRHWFMALSTEARIFSLTTVLLGAVSIVLLVLLRREKKRPSIVLPSPMPAFLLPIRVRPV